MGIEKAKATAKRMWTIWLVAIIVFWAASGLYNLHMMMETGESAIAMLSGLQIVTLIATALFFLPSIVIIRHHAKLAQIKWLTVCATVLSIFLTSWTVLSLLATVYALLTT